MDAPKGNMSSLEQGLVELESLVQKLESGQMGIDEAIDAYSKGMKLAVSCKKSLDSMVQKITVARDEARRVMEEGGAEDAQEEESSSAESDLPF